MRHSTQFRPPEPAKPVLRDGLKSAGVILLGMAFIAIIAYVLHRQETAPRPTEEQRRVALQQQADPFTKPLIVTGAGYTVKVGAAVNKYPNVIGPVQALEAPTYVDAQGEKEAWLTCQLVDAKGNLIAGGAMAPLRLGLGGKMELQGTDYRPGSLKCRIIPGLPDGVAIPPADVAR
jgi:cbb3-type cytochrome oxidase subunit 3